MKLSVQKKNLAENFEYFLRRRFFYKKINNRHTGEDSFVRQLTPNRYPRFHMYVRDEGERIIFNLHLDQKEASYKGSHAHNAEYEGEVVEAEIARLKAELNIEDEKTHSNKSSSSGKDKFKSAESLLGKGVYDKKEIVKKKRKGVLQKIFFLFKD